MPLSTAGRYACRYLVAMCARALLRVTSKTAVETPATVGHYPAHVMCNQNSFFPHQLSFNNGATRQKANSLDL
jgi:hypothetical protein